MLYVLLFEGSLVELRDAETVEVDGDDVNILDALGVLVQWYHVTDVTAYGNYEAMAQRRDELLH